MVLTLRWAKTDREGAGAEIAIPHGTSARTCPVATLEAWLGAAAMEVGPTFVPVSRHSRASTTQLSDRDVARVVRTAGGATGYRAADFAGHSLRSGLISTAARAGVPEADIENQSRHKSLPVLRGFTRRGPLLVDNADARVETGNVSFDTR